MVLEMFGTGWTSCNEVIRHDAVRTTIPHSHHRVGIIMKISFLGQGEDPKAVFADLDFLEEVSINTITLPCANSFYILEFELDGDSLSAAKKLAEIRDNILIHDLRLLDDDASERFERDLFKQIALFERRIRKLLTICLCSQEGHLDVDLVKKLEKLTFGDLFNTLFVDEQFNKEVKQAVNQRSSLFEKQELIKELSKIDENSLWMKTFSGDEMPSLQSGHKKLQDYRNDTMHAHRMTLDTYKEAIKLLRTINEELNRSIQRRLENTLSIDYAQLVESLSRTLETIRETFLKAYDFESFFNAFQRAATLWRDPSEEDKNEGAEEK